MIFHTFRNWGKLVSAFDNSMTTLELIKCLRKMLDEVHENEVELNEKLNNLITFIEKDGFQKYVVEELIRMEESGELAGIINQEIFGNLNTLITSNTDKISSLEVKTDTTNGDVNTLKTDLTQVRNDLQDSIEYQNKLMVTPQMFGAKGDGEQDDTNAIQQAVDYVFNASSSGAGGYVFLPSGLYKVSRPINVHGNLTILGIGSGSSRLVPTANFAGQAVIQRLGSIASYWLTLRDFTIDMINVPQSNGINAIYLQAMVESKMINLNLRSVTKHGIVLETFGGALIQPEVSNCIMRANQNNPSGIGIWINTGYDATIQNNDIGYFKGAGIQCNYSNGNIISKNNCWQCGYGYYFENCNRQRISDNLSDYAKKHGFLFNVCSEIQMSNNQSRWSSDSQPEAYDAFRFTAITETVIIGSLALSGDGTPGGGTVGVGRANVGYNFAGLCIAVKLVGSLSKNIFYDTNIENPSSTVTII